MSILQELVHESGITNIHFFNGRLLTGTDLRDEQNANREHRALLGKAIGSGVVSGLQVTVDDEVAPRVTVAAGCAVNQLGRVLNLGADTTVSLSESATEEGTVESGEDFSECLPVVTASLDSETASGVFILAIGPASAFEGQATKHESFDAGTATGCGSAYQRRSVQFRLIAVEGAPGSGGDATVQGISSYRSELAHWFLHSPALAGYAQNPFFDRSSYGPIDGMRADSDETGKKLLTCEVPLAVLWWDGSAGLRFLDNWPVRRRLVKALADESWPLHTQDRRLAEAEAVFLQFQDHLAWLQSKGVGAISAINYFDRLPPAGFVPGYFEPEIFFEGLGIEEQFTLDAAFLRSILHSSFFVESIDLAAGSRPSLRLYHAPAGATDYVVFLRAENLEAMVAEAEEETGEVEFEVDLSDDVRDAGESKVIIVDGSGKIYDVDVLEYDTSGPTPRVRYGAKGLPTKGELMVISAVKGEAPVAEKFSVSKEETTNVVLRRAIH